MPGGSPILGGSNNVGVASAVSLAAAAAVAACGAAASSPLAAAAAVAASAGATVGFSAVVDGVVAANPDTSSLIQQNADGQTILPVNGKLLFLFLVNRNSLRIFIFVEPHDRTQCFLFQQKMSMPINHA